MKLFNKNKGDEGENTAYNYLKNKKYKIVETNYRCLYGEIDIIAEKGNELIFVEVKYRSADGFGKGYEAVTKTKRDKIIKTAQIYINEKNITTPCRFDVISIDDGVINHIENAFSL